MDTVTKVISGDNNEPQRIGNFVVLCKLGEGGMGAVYKAHDPDLDRIVALKLLPPHLAANPDFITRFHREAATAAKFTHHNLVQVHSAGEAAGTHFIAMEFVEGQSLKHHIEDCQRLDCHEALAIIIHAAEGLSYAWNKAKLIHRDIKPDNILLSTAGEVKVADLGLAKTIESISTDFTSTGTVMGSPHYISPEQARGDKEIDFHTDIYSLGATLYHMLAGRTPYQADTPMALMYKHVHEPPPDLGAVRPDCPARVAELVKKMMAKDRAKRPASYEELIAELTAARKAPGKPGTAGSAAKSRKMMMLTGAGVVVAAAVVGVLVWQPWKQSGTGILPVQSSSKGQAGSLPHTVGVAAPVPGRAAVVTPPTQPSPQPPGTAATTPAVPTTTVVVETAKPPPPPQVTATNIAQPTAISATGGQAAAKTEPPKPVPPPQVTTQPTVPTATVRQETATTPATPTNDFIATVAALPPEKKLAAVLAKLKELNPNFDGKFAHKVEAGAVTELAISSVGVTDLTPVRALRSLKKLTVVPWAANQKGTLNELTALKELPLTMLWCQNNPIRDLAPLKGMALTMLSIGGTQVSDLVPLSEMKLTVLGCNDTAVDDLQPLEGMPLTVVWCQNTKVTDLTPLRAAPLQELRCDPSVAAQNVGVLRGIKTLTKINDLTAAAFFMTTAMAKPVIAPRATVGVGSTPQKKMTIALGSGVKMEFILVPVGSFMMGSDKYKDAEKPVHKVTLTKPFYIGKYEVTQEQWQKVMGDNPSRFKGAKNPVDMVSWDDCQKFVTKLKDRERGQTFRLPTEAEWEYACQAGSTTDYCYGDNADKLGDYAWFKGNSRERTYPVGQKKPNAWGLYDMHSNIAEWCQDVYHGIYEGAPADGSARLDGGSLRVLRGGSWYSDATGLRSASRSGNPPGSRPSHCGLRVVVEVGTP